MALITNNPQVNHIYPKINYFVPVWSLFPFLKDLAFIDVFKSNIPQIESSKESKIAEIPDTGIYHILSFLEKPSDFSSFSRTNRAFFSLSGQMPAHQNASDSMLFFLYGRHLFHDKSYSRHSEGLVQAVAMRPLTSQEWFISLACFTGSGAVKLANARAKKAEQWFFAAFKQRCRELSAINDTARFAVYRECAFNALEGIARSNVSYFQRAVFSLKLASVRYQFDRKLYLDMILAYVQQDAKVISQQNFLSTTKKFSELFPEIAIVDVERDLRNALRKRHSEAFEKLAEFFSHPEYIYPEIKEIDEQAKNQLTKIENFGEILKDAESKKQEAFKELSRIFKETCGYLNQNELMHQSMSEDASVTEARNQYYAAMHTFSNDTKKYDALLKGLNALLQIREDLKEKADRKATFYRELQKEVTENQKLALSHTLHQNIGFFH